MQREGDKYVMMVKLENKSKVRALMIRLKVQGRKIGERVLPVFYEDNYFSLLPGEKKTVMVTFKAEDAHGEVPALAVEGFNIKPSVH